LTRNKKQILIGLTGGIASGKTAVSGILVDLGAYIIDTDVISRRLTGAGGGAVDAVLSAFGVNDGRGGIDRVKLRETVFNGDGDYRRLNALLHPLIYAETKKLLKENVDKPIIVIVAPLLFEADFKFPYDAVWTVSCPEETRIKRAAARDNIDESTLRRITAKQLTDAQREKLACAVIDNSGSLEDLRKNVEKELWKLKAGLFSR